MILKMRKRGLELSINFIIILVLAVVTLVMGIVIFNIVFRTGIELEREVSQSTKDQINRLLMAGDDETILPDFYRTMKIAEQQAFGLGIRNFKNTQQQFTINMQFDLAVDKDNADKTQQVIAGGGVMDWHFERIGPVSVAPNNIEVISIPLNVRSNAKTDWIYVFNIWVTDSDGQQYGDLQKIYIRIK